MDVFPSTSSKSVVFLEVMTSIPIGNERLWHVDRWFEDLSHIRDHWREQRQGMTYSLTNNHGKLEQ
jgi:hypothetical protein